MKGRDVAILATSAVAACAACAVGVALWGIDTAIRRINEAFIGEPVMDLAGYEAHGWPTEDITHRDGLAWHTCN